MKYFFVIIFTLTQFIVYSQTRNNVSGTFVTGSISSGGSTDFVFNSIFNDLTGTYTANDIQVGDEIWDSKCDRYRIDVINQITPNIQVDVTDLNGVNPSTGNGFLFRPTANFDYPLATSGLSNTLLSCLEKHRAIEIDEDIFGVDDLQTISRGGSDLTLSDGGGTVSVNDADFDPSNEIQTISKSGSTVTLSNSGGSFTDSVDDADNDPSNEIELPSGGSNGDVLQTDGSGNYTWGTPSVGGQMHVYQSGNALVMSFGGNSGDVTYSLVGNIGTVTVPSGVRLMYVRVNEESGNLGGDTDFILRVVDGNADVNQGTVSTFMPPSTDFIKRDNLNNDPPTTNFPFIYTVDAAPTPQVQVAGYGSNQLDVTFKNVDSFSKWTAILNF